MHVTWVATANPFPQLMILKWPGPHSLDIFPLCHWVKHPPSQIKYKHLSFQSTYCQVKPQSRLRPKVETPAVMHSRQVKRDWVWGFYPYTVKVFGQDSYLPALCLGAFVISSHPHSPLPAAAGVINKLQMRKQTAWAEQTPPGSPSWEPAG